MFDLLVFLFLSFFATKADGYRGKVLLVQNGQAVIAIQSKNAQKGDELMFYDEYLVQLGTAKISRFGKKKTRALVTLPDGFSVKKGDTFELMESKGLTEEDKTMEPMKFYAKKPPEPEKPDPKQWEILFGGQSLVLEQQKGSQLGQVDLSGFYWFLTTLQLGGRVQSSSAGAIRDGWSLGFQINWPGKFVERSYFLSVLSGQVRRAGRTAHSRLDLKIGKRFSILKGLSWSPTLARVSEAEIDFESYQLNLFQFSLLF